MFYFLLKVLPLSFLSRVTGVLAQLRLPTPLQTQFNRAFVSFFGIDLSEASQTNPKDYASVEDVFTRSLVANARPAPSSSNGAVFVSPADGVVNISAPASDLGEGIQTEFAVKSLRFSLKELVSRIDFLPAWYTTVYLAPHNYHRVHAPVSGTLKTISYHPGKLFPVNRYCVDRIPRLYWQNERLVFTIELKDDPSALCFAVMVGALNVGRMRSPFLENFYSNGAFFPQAKMFAIEREIRAMDEIGTFMLGSTVVMVLNDRARALLNPVAIKEPTPIRMGSLLKGVKI